jgi:hypothetical protein
VVNSPRRIEERIWRLRQGLDSILMTELEHQEEILLATIGQRYRTERSQLLRHFRVNRRISKALIRADLTSQELSEI